ARRCGRISVPGAHRLWSWLLQSLSGKEEELEYQDAGEAEPGKRILIMVIGRRGEVLRQLRQRTARRRHGAHGYEHVGGDVVQPHPGGDFCRVQRVVEAVGGVVLA